MAMSLLRGWESHHVLITDEDSTFVDWFKTSEHSQARGLPATRWTHEHHKLTVTDLEIQSIDGLAIRLRIYP